MFNEFYTLSYTFLLSREALSIVCYKVKEDSRVGDGLEDIYEIFSEEDRSFLWPEIFKKLKNVGAIKGSASGKIAI